MGNIIVTIDAMVVIYQGTDVIVFGRHVQQCKSHYREFHYKTRLRSVECGIYPIATRYVTSCYDGNDFIASCQL